jgi:hypothetical protein
MKYDNIFLKDLFDEGQALLKAQETLDARKKTLNQQKKDYIKDYFKRYGIDIEVARILPLNHNTFISYPDFSITQNGQGKISWIARGKRTSIKDGHATSRNTPEEFWQGQWEALPEGIQKLTIEQAKENSKSLFPISPANFNGTAYAAPAYVLHKSDDGFQLVWRKAGTAYIDRMAGSATASSGLQILYVKKSTNFREGCDEERKAWDKLNEKYQAAIRTNKKFSNTLSYLTEGGRLSVGLLEKEEQKIDLIFGDGTTQGIIEKLKLQQANKTTKKKELKGIEHKDAKWDEPEPLKHPNVQPGKLKL